MIRPDVIREVDLATSTIALSVYNSLVAVGLPQTLEQIYHTICIGHNTEISKAQFIEAMHGLCKRKYLRIHLKESNSDTERFSIVDSIRRHVRWRNRSGDGWDNWSVQHGNGIKRLEEVIHV